MLFVNSHSVGRGCFWRGGVGGGLDEVTSCGRSERVIQDIVRNMRCHPLGHLFRLSSRSFEGKGKGNRTLSSVYAGGREEERNGHRGLAGCGASGQDLSFVA